MAGPDYCSVEDVVDVLTRDAAVVTGNAASIDREAVEKAVRDAASEIDSRLATKYTVPFNPVPSLINSIAQDIAAYLADLVFRENRDYGSEFSPIYLRYQRAQATLGRLSTGEAIIPPDSSDPANPPDTGVGYRVAAVVSRPSLISPCDFPMWAHPGYRPDYWTPDGWGQF